jgi:hypothetical protein
MSASISYTPIWTPGDSLSTSDAPAELSSWTQIGLSIGPREPVSRWGRPDRSRRISAKSSHPSGGHDSDVVRLIGRTMGTGHLRRRDPWVPGWLVAGWTGAYCQQRTAHDRALAAPRHGTSRLQLTIDDRGHRKMNRGADRDRSAPLGVGAGRRSRPRARRTTSRQCRI